jgi:outer membrane receptor protein involved in Fe transport
MKFGSSLSAIYNEKKKNISDDWTYFVPPSSTVLDLNTYYYFEDNSLLKLSIRNLTDQKYWLWPNAGRVVHSFSENKELSTMPGVNFILSYTKEI